MIEGKLADRFTPPEDPAFFDELWRRAEIADRAAARRWRRIAIAVVAVSITAAASMGVVAATRGAASVVDTTVRCAVEDRGGVASFAVSAAPNTRYPSGDPIPAGFGVMTGQNTLLFVVDRRYKGYRLDEQACHKAPRISLDSKGLPPTPQIYRSGQYGSFDLNCTVGDLLFRVKFVQDSNGLVSSAQLAVRATRTKRPIAYVEWTPTKVTAYAVPPERCAAY